VTNVAAKPNVASVGPPRRTNFVSEEEWRTFADIKASITGQKGESAVACEIARLGLPALHDVILSDSRGVTKVDHLVLGVDAIIVIETKAFGGFITGDLQGLQWTQHLAGGTMRDPFQNPARQNYRHCSAVREILSRLSTNRPELVPYVGMSADSPPMSGDSERCGRSCRD
jgi:hypothetical protein